MLAFLQLPAQERLTLGVSTQINNTRLLVDLSSTKVKGALRPSGILFAELDFARDLALHGGMGYTMMTLNSDAFKNDFHYLAVPLHLKIGRLKDERPVAFISYIGLDLHYLLCANHYSLDGEKFQCRMQLEPGLQVLKNRRPIYLITALLTGLILSSCEDMVPSDTNLPLEQRINQLVEPIPVW